MEKIIFDTDPGVDDALAIILALHAPDIQVRAVTTVAGNVGIEDVTRNALTILELCNQTQIPVYRGCEKALRARESSAQHVHGEDGLGNKGFRPVHMSREKQHAVDFLIKVSKEEDDLTIAAIGPLTNLAAAVLKDAGFASRIKKLVIMGGAEFGGNVTPAAEFNFYQDPEAAKIVFDAGFREIIMVGLDATKKIMLTPALRELIHQIDTPVSRFIYEITEVYVKCQWNWSRTLSCELCDVLTTAYLMNPAVLSKVPARVKIETEGVCRGSSIVYRTETYKEMSSNAYVAVDADTRLFFEIFFQHVFPEYLGYAKEIMEHELDKR